MYSAVQFLSKYFGCEPAKLVEVLTIRDNWTKATDTLRKTKLACPHLGPSYIVYFIGFSKGNAMEDRVLNEDNYTNYTVQEHLRKVCGIE